MILHGIKTTDYNLPLYPAARASRPPLPVSSLLAAERGRQVGLNMVDLSGVAEIKCSKCNNVFDVDGSDIYVEAIGSDEKNMACGTFLYMLITYFSSILKSYLYRHHP